MMSILIMSVIAKKNVQAETLCIMIPSPVDGSVNCPHIAIGVVTRPGARGPGNVVPMLLILSPEFIRCKRALGT